MGLRLTAWAYCGFVTYRQQKNRVAAFQVKTVTAIVALVEDGVAEYSHSFWRIWSVWTRYVYCSNYEIILAHCCSGKYLCIYRLGPSSYCSSEYAPFRLVGVVCRIGCFLFRILPRAGFMTWLSCLFASPGLSLLSFC